jgi:hypothetical protein
METPLAPPYTNRPSAVPGEPMDLRTGVLESEQTLDGLTTAWAPPPPDARSPRRRGRFGAGVIVGVALTGAAVGGYAAGQQDTPPTPAAVPAASSDVAADPVSVSTGTIGDLVEAARPSVVAVRQDVTRRARPAPHDAVRPPAPGSSCRPTATSSPTTM